MGGGFHLSSFMFSISRVPLNHQAQGTSTWLIIGSNSRNVEPNTLCYGYVMPLWLSMPVSHTSTVHLSCTLLVLSKSSLLVYNFMFAFLSSQFVVLVLLNIRNCEVTSCSSSYHGEACFQHYGPRLWNSLPKDLRAAENVHVFKSRLKTHLFSLAFN